MMKIGVLAFQGDVLEHVRATRAAAGKLGVGCAVSEVRSTPGLEGLDGLIIPGGESTTLFKLCERENMLESMSRTPKIFGTCAGAIMLAKKIHGAESGQKTLSLMDIEIDRNAYGRQSESFEQKISTELGALNAVFIRAPRIRRIGNGVRVLAGRAGEVLACEQFLGHNYYLAACFHPELTTTKFHERFLQSALKYV